jgi:hypothetical protein
MSDEASNLHEQAIVVVGHSDIVASDVDWRRESGERGCWTADICPLRAGGVTVICDHVGGDAPQVSSSNAAVDKLCSASCAPSTTRMPRSQILAFHPRGHDR